MSAYRRFVLVPVLALVLAPAGAALADIKPGDGKKDKVPDKQGQGADLPDDAKQPQKNPLPEIVELMKQVQQKLAETDTGKWTQEEQEAIAKALTFEGQSVDALKKLIEEVESQAQSQSSGGGESQQKKDQQSKERSKSQQQMRERQSDQQSKPQNPGSDKQEQEKKAREQKERDRQKQAENDKKTEGAPPNPDYKLDKSKAPNPAESWGQLPPKQAREVLESKKREYPIQWRKQLEDYFRKLSEQKK